MQQARYIDKLVSLCSDHKFGSEAVEWYILSGQVSLKYNDIEEDLRTIMGHPGYPETGLYDKIIEDYQNVCRAIHVEGNEITPEQHAIHLQRHEKKP